MVTWDSWTLVNAFRFVICWCFGFLALFATCLPVSQSGIWVLFLANYDIHTSLRKYIIAVYFCFAILWPTYTRQIFFLRVILSFFIFPQIFHTTFSTAGKEKESQTFGTYFDTRLFCNIALQSKVMPGNYNSCACEERILNKTAEWQSFVL